MDNRSTSVWMAPSQPPSGLTLSASHKSTTTNVLARLNHVAASSAAVIAASDASDSDVALGSAGGHGATGSSSGMVEAVPSGDAGGVAHRGGHGAAGSDNGDGDSDVVDGIDGTMMGGSTCLFRRQYKLRVVGSCRSLRSSKLVTISSAPEYSLSWMHNTCNKHCIDVCCGCNAWMRETGSALAK